MQMTHGVPGAAAGPPAPAGPPRATTATDELAAALERIASLWRRLAVPGELSSTAALTLARLSKGGPCRLTDLAAREHVTQPAMSQLVSRLEGQGLAERAGDPADARVVRVAITADGEELVALRRATRAAWFAGMFEGLPAGQQAALAAALPALQSLARAGGAQPASALAGAPATGNPR